jgi:hypothetical protein
LAGWIKVCGEKRRFVFFVPFVVKPRCASNQRSLPEGQKLCGEKPHILFFLRFLVKPPLRIESVVLYP